MISELWQRFLHGFARRFPVRYIVGRDGDLYLSRYTIFGDGGNLTPEDPKQCARFSIFLHRFTRPDLDRELHSHPWRWSFALVLYGGYVEQRGKLSGNPFWSGVLLVRNFARLPFRLNIFRRGDFHRIECLLKSECWTLFIAGPKISDWGFFVEGRGFVPHEKYFKEKGF